MWIKAELHTTTSVVTKALDSYKLNEAAEAVYEFVWHKFADIYLEKTKDRKAAAQPVLFEVLESSLKLLQPFMPFVTEQIWQETHQDSLLMTSSWPKA